MVLGIDQFSTQRKYDSSWYIPSSLDPDWQDITRDSLCLRSASSLSRSEPHKLGFQSLVILYTRNRNQHQKSKQIRAPSSILNNCIANSIDYFNSWHSFFIFNQNLNLHCLCLQGQLSMDPNGHSFCSSSVMTYSKVGDEPPKVFQASTQTRRAPGGVSFYYYCVVLQCRPCCPPTWSSPASVS